MKFALGVLLFTWLLCGIVGAWWIDELSLRHWDKIARGPITLVHALNDNPVSYPGPD